MVTVVDAATALVFTGKVALVAPAGTATLEGTLADPLLLESASCAPPAGAGPLNVTAPVEDCAPPITLVGFSVSERDDWKWWGRHSERGRSAHTAIGRGDGNRGRRSHRARVHREGRASGSGGNRHARRYAGRPVVTRKRHLRSTCRCWPAQRYRARGGLCPANNARGIQRQRRDDWKWWGRHSERGRSGHGRRRPRRW